VVLVNTAPNIEHTKARIGFVAASRRGRCGTCRHVTEPREGFFSCGQHGLMVTAYAVCRDYERGAPRQVVPP
jgi:hypothetical protein